ncbi:MAG: YqgE/AlgH family protein [SAR324 cluster bacterium]|nr:YqgE/AlgH family protein [SAR324 cluster bacterium]MBF0350657.1 YqgE/AlgH family protein [SAR324 cluster bacterium]
MENEMIPGLLVAMPSLQDSYFEKTVVLMLNYNSNGAFGVVINKNSNNLIKDLLVNKDNVNSDKFNFPLLLGGPVQTDSFWALHSPDFSGESSTTVSTNISISSAQEVLLAIVGDEGPQQLHIGCGYAGWGPGQLDREIEDESWWLMPLNESLVMTTEHKKQWEIMIHDLGIDPLMAFIKSGTV